jgi:uncharacterized FlgJ-related protein
VAKEKYKIMYKYDKNSLQFVRTRKCLLPYVACIILLIGYAVNVNYTAKEWVKSEPVVIVLEQTPFSNERLIETIKELNFRFPHIVYAQAILETNHFKSPLFKENHNLFGMREATLRVTLAKGTKNNHAYYKDWKDSLYDYGMYYSTYLYRITTEENYYSYLQQYYAEDVEYVDKLKKIVKQQNNYFNTD